MSGREILYLSLLAILTLLIVRNAAAFNNVLTAAGDNYRQQVAAFQGFDV